jgi:hypothetical protein
MKATVQQLIAELAQHGIRVEARGDRLRLRGPSAPPVELHERVRQAKPELLQLLSTTAPPKERSAIEEAEIDRLARSNGRRPLPKPGSPAYSIVEECRKYGVALRIDEAGDLVVGKAGAKADEPSQPWRELLTQIEAQLEPVARLVEAGWTLKAGFSKRETA